MLLTSPSSFWPAAQADAASHRADRVDLNSILVVANGQVCVRRVGVPIGSSVRVVCQESRCRPRRKIGVGDVKIRSVVVVCGVVE